MSDVVGKLRIFGLLLIIAAGLVLASAASANHSGADERFRVDGQQALLHELATDDGQCVVVKASDDCPACCHDMGEAECCGPSVALSVSTFDLQFAPRNGQAVWWPARPIHGTSSDVGKRPPRQLI